MTKGFTYLEKGNYTNAITFFEDILKDYPDDKTVQLCYGRAIGLSGDAQNAKAIFTDLLKQYPNDFEIALNYAESLLWDNDFDLAKPYYENLIAKNNQSFHALLGYANTLSNLKLYEGALTFVNKALAVSEGNPRYLAKIGHGSCCYIYSV
ncbi:hypothetical protein MHTCC0001_07880 [Flavobacteriaceae bacterium MHTCC 0001]